jgi:hypothetical protein
MSKDKRSNTANAAKGSTTAGDSRSTDDIVAREHEQGFRGTEVDPTPNENYTVQGVTSGAPTPETDVDHAAEVRKQTGLGLSPLEAADREKTLRGEK